LAKKTTTPKLTKNEQLQKRRFDDFMREHGAELKTDNSLCPPGWKRGYPSGILAIQSISTGEVYLPEEFDEMSVCDDPERKRAAQERGSAAISRFILEP